MLLREPLDPSDQSRKESGAALPAREVPGSRESRAPGMPSSCSGALAVLSRQRNGLELARSVAGFDAVALGFFVKASDWMIQRPHRLACARLLKRAASRGPGHPGSLGLAARMPLGDEVERACRARPALALVDQREQQTDTAGTAGGAPPHLRVRQACAAAGGEEGCGAEPGAPRACRSRRCSGQHRRNPCAQ